MGFSGQECWNRLPFPHPGDLLDPRIEPCISCVSCIIGRFFPTELPGKLKCCLTIHSFILKNKNLKKFNAIKIKDGGLPLWVLHIKPANASDVGQEFIFRCCCWGGWGSSALDMWQEVGSCSGSAAALDQGCQWSRYVGKGWVSALALPLWPVGPFAPLVRLLGCFF